MKLSLIIPVLNGGEAFRQCLTSLLSVTPQAHEIIVVGDGDTDGSRSFARQNGCIVIENAAPLGPARARNQAARQAAGDILFFIDADVTVPMDAIGRVIAEFVRDPELAAIIGSYDANPLALGFFAQYKNLQHHFVHQTGSEEAFTFWGACGAIRRDLFLEIGGFDETYTRPSIEDIELGYRLKRAGHRIRLVKDLQVKHLKAWTMSSQLRSDFFDRALPWTRLLARSGAIANDLNINVSSRTSAALVFVLLGLLGLSMVAGGWFALAALLPALALLYLNAPLYRFFLRARGLWFTMRAVPWHWFYYLYSGVAYIVGNLQHLLSQPRPPAESDLEHVSHAFKSEGRSADTRSALLPQNETAFESVKPGEQVVIIGGGPAGLTAAYELSKHGARPLVLERGERVGGISRTDIYKGYRFDIGGHRFYTKVDEVANLWVEVLGKDFIKRPRLSRIFYNGAYFAYPLQFMETFHKLGAFESFLMFLSYLKWQVFPYPQEETLTEWVTNRFGRRLFRTFFRTYTEKVWGISCDEIQAEWAAQRIKGLDFKSVVMNAVFKPRKTNVKTLIEEFDYPKLGPGMMWEQFAEATEARGGKVELQTSVEQLLVEGNRVTHVRTSCNGESVTLPVSQVISSLALLHLIEAIHPAPPSAVLEAARGLRYRDFLVVCLIIDEPVSFPDNWIYIHSPDVRVGRIQNFKNWSPDLLPDQSKTSLGMEYFCNVGDALWSMTDDALIALAKQELGNLGLTNPQRVLDGCVLRQLKAYPVYDGEYRGHLQVIKDYLATITNLQTVGRNGLHRYNNQDHSMLTGLLAARNLLGEKHDIWEVNTERSYYETFEVDRKSDRPTDSQVIAVATK
jgi:protoporphyrinogen oxidase/GT2 family glycosyltransferase